MPSDILRATPPLEMWITRPGRMFAHQSHAPRKSRIRKSMPAPTLRSKLAAWMRADDAPTRLTRRIFWTGFLVRVLYMTLAHTYRFRVFGDHFEFGWEMGRIARSLATGYGYSSPFTGHTGPTAWTPPLYPLLIAAVFKIFGVYTLKSSWVILTLNSIFSAATAVAIYEIALRCFTPVRGAIASTDPDAKSIALWSAWLWALYPAAMQYAVRWVWDMALTAFLFSGVLVLALRLRNIEGSASDSGGPSFAPSAKGGLSRPSATRFWLLFGALWGLIALSNSSLLTFLPACGLWIIWPTFRQQQSGAPFTQSHRVSGLPQMLTGPILSAIIFLAVITPWVVRNYTVFHAFVPMRSNFGAELYEATLYSNDGFPSMATLPQSERAPEFQRYEHLGEVAYSKQQGERAKARIRAHPGLFIRSALRRVYFFWVSVPHPPDSGVFVEAMRRINFAVASFSGILGLALALRRRIPGAWLFFWAFAICPFLYYLVTVQARFRHPLEPLLCILSVYLFHSADRTRTWSWRRPTIPAK
jgi:hypothetical protein